jgi:hypothetical protein
LRKQSKRRDDFGVSDAPGDVRAAVRSPTFKILERARIIKTRYGPVNQHGAGARNSRVSMDVARRFTTIANSVEAP